MSDEAFVPTEPGWYWFAHEEGDEPFITEVYMDKPPFPPILRDRSTDMPIAVIAEFGKFHPVPMQKPEGF